MLFARGQWAVLGVEPNTQTVFEEAISNPLTIFKVSQLAASIKTKFKSESTSGITPFGSPRLDEKLAWDSPLLGDFQGILESEGAAEDAGFILSNLEYIGSLGDYSLGNNQYAFWFVLNDYDDPSCPSSKKEQIAYEELERPFKFLIKDEKKGVEEKVKAQSVLNRSQFPVLVDFQHGRVYVASANVEEVSAVRALLESLGAKLVSLAWDFRDFDWPTRFLNKVAAETHFSAEMKERADELSRFRADEIEKLEDKTMEKIVSNFFALSQLDSELWAGLTTPARVRIHKPIDPVTIGNPSVAFSLLNMSNDAQVAAASVVFQEVTSKFTKAGEEKTYRNDVFTIDINDNVNLPDAGAAMLRGFDLPRFKREVKVASKAKGKLGIRDFWSMWLQGIHDSILEFTANVNDVLELDKRRYGLNIMESEPETTEDV